MTRKNQPAPKSFEEAISELEQILAAMEGDEVGLEESLAKYERGAFLIQHCRAVLNLAQKRIEQLSKAEDDPAKTQPLPQEAP